MLSIKNYEERNYTYMTDRPDDQTTQKMILGGNQNDLFKSLVEMSEKLRNPFLSILYWVKGQIADIKAMD